jgi:hypothetical protein
VIPPHVRVALAAVLIACAPEGAGSAGTTFAAATFAAATSNTARAAAGADSTRAAPGSAAPFALSPADSLLRARGSAWGPAPDREAGPRVDARTPPKPLWEQIVLIPYHVIGLPFRGLNWLIKAGVVAAQEAGLLDIFAEVAGGIPGPWGSYILPTFGISDARGTEYGLTLHHDRFLGGPHRLRIAAATSSQRADDVNVGLRFELSDVQRLDVATGYSDNPGAKYYGLGYDSAADERSYYRRQVRWAGLAGRR